MEVSKNNNGRYVRSSQSSDFPSELKAMEGKKVSFNSGVLGVIDCVARINGDYLIEVELESSLRPETGEKYLLTPLNKLKDFKINISIEQIMNLPIYKGDPGAVSSTSLEVGFPDENDSFSGIFIFGPKNFNGSNEETIPVTAFSTD